MLNKKNQNINLSQLFLNKPSFWSNEFMAVHHTKIVKHKPELQIRTAYSTKPLLLCEYQF